MFQSAAIHDRNAAACITNQPSLLQLECGLRHPFATHAEHVGNQFLRHHQICARQAVQAQQQPAAQLLVERMMAVTHRCLRHLRDQRLGIAKQKARDRAESLKLIFHELRFQLEAFARALHDRAAGRGIAAMNNEMPTMPSLPTTAISPESPFSFTYSNETMAEVGKYTIFSVAPASGFVFSFHLGFPVTIHR